MFAAPSIASRITGSTTHSPRSRNARSTLAVRFPFIALSLAALASTACGSAAGVTDPASSDPASQADAGEPSALPDGGTSSPSTTAPGASADGGTTSRCKVTDDTVFCDHNVTKVVAGTASRDVYWQTPTTPAPPGGYPIVLLYQGSFGGPSLTWSVLTPDVAFGGFYQGKLQAMLLDNGFTVVAPEAAAGVAWQTNSGLPYDATTDKPIIDAVLTAIRDGQFGPADATRMYATGISSGGYMTSRMAVSYAGVFRALAIQSASYATCVGPVCVVPNDLPADHPPTLFLHGEVDTTVPIFTARQYYDALREKGFETAMVTDPTAGHQWLTQSPERVTDWFMKH